MNRPASNEVTQKEFAALRGVSPALISKLKDQGRLVMNAAGNRVLVQESIDRIERSRDPARGGARSIKGKASTTPSQSGSGNSRSGSDPAEGGLVYQAEAAREKRAAAQLRELELAEKAGELVSAALAERQTFNLARAARDAVIALPDRLATLAAAETDPVKVHALLTAECRRICKLLADEAAAGAQDAQEAA